jgi:hypothetical protein
MPVLGNKCAAGLPNMIRLSPEQFKPRDPRLGADGNITATCHFCGQDTMVKIRDPRKGFFVEHDESQQGFKSMHDKRPGTPARERKRRK